ncbi:MAG: SEC-C domain-containing protein [Prosthecobacter sp.]
MLSTSPNPEWTVESILDALANAPAHIVPKEALAAAHEHQQSLIAPLQAAVDQTYALSADGRLQSEGDWRIHSFALHLLAAWCVPGTYDRIWKGLTLDDRYDSLWLMAAAYLEWPHLLITTFDGGVDRLLRIARQEDPPWNCEVRQCAIMVLAAAHHHHLGDRAAIQTAFETLLDEWDEDVILLGTLLMFVLSLKIHPLIPKANRILKTPLGRQALGKLDAEEALKSSWRDDFRDSSTYPNPLVRPQQDLLTIISGWRYFKKPLTSSLATSEMESEWIKELTQEERLHDSTSRPGGFILRKRTLPCTCGSGLPFGSCCAGK